MGLQEAKACSQQFQVESKHTVPFCLRAELITKYLCISFVSVNEALALHLSVSFLQFAVVPPLFTAWGLSGL